MAAGLKVIESIQNDVEFLDKRNVKKRTVLDVRMVSSDGGGRTKGLDSRSRGLGLTHAHVAAAEQKLTVQVAHLNSVQVDHFNVAESGADEGFEEFASDTTRTDAKNSCIFNLKEDSHNPEDD
eukprot:CAMPEP_0175041330 /NCGR_PEP_ID=MMETSP0052_2-20121109/1848_1 /TAXON_ID=51329 ORGANISM="Polytomella parva, Strain SAG 63-3" /NCGR_SAMPLE_ID=MMETSP0052_2 /ASSEMBLY_ACC=CAM_ASM_000194 /LENGTH=122 /DNA_ID=CAMNT_0016303819 /DNA_START=135 /DNA_END=500 /DNA_ORIENTATION=-